MADWTTVRYDPTYEEPVDPELIPLLDALNGAGIVTTSSCSGHGTRWPYVAFAHSLDEARIERLARFVKAFEHHDYHPYFTMWQKEILLEPNALSHGHAYHWSIEIHLNNCYGDTPAKEMMAEAVKALEAITIKVIQFAESEKQGGVVVAPLELIQDSVPDLLAGWFRERTGVCAELRDCECGHPFSRHHDCPDCNYDGCREEGCCCKGYTESAAPAEEGSR